MPNSWSVTCWLAICRPIPHPQEGITETVDFNQALLNGTTAHKDPGVAHHSKTAHPEEVANVTDLPCSRDMW